MALAALTLLPATLTTRGLREYAGDVQEFDAAS